MSINAAIRGNYLQAERLALEDQALIRVNGQRMNLGVAHYAFANAVLAQGRVDEAYQAIKEAIDLCKEYQQHWFMAYCLTTLGSIEFTRGNLMLASTHYQAAYELREKFNDSEGMAVALNKLGEIALTTGDNEMARQRYEHSLVLYRDLNDRGGLATVLKGLGDVEQVEGRYGQAAQHYHDALRTACDMNYVSLIFSLLVTISSLFLRINDRTSASSLLILVSHHPASDHTSREHARILLEEHNTPMPQPATNTDWKAVLVNVCEMTSRQLQTMHQSE